MIKTPARLSPWAQKPTDPAALQRPGHGHVTVDGGDDLGQSQAGPDDTGGLPVELHEHRQDEFMPRTLLDLVRFAPR